MSDGVNSLVSISSSAPIATVVRANPLISRGLSEVNSFVPKDAFFFFDRCVERYANGEYDEAYRDCEEAIRLNPQMAGAYHMRGKLWRNWGMHGKAMKDFAIAIHHDRSNAEYYYDLAINIGSALSYRNRVDLLSEAIRLNPDFKDAYKKRGIYWQHVYPCDVAEYESATRDFSRAMQLDPKDSECDEMRKALLQILERYRTRAMA